MLVIAHASRRRQCGLRIFLNPGGNMPYYRTLVAFLLACASCPMAAAYSLQPYQSQATGSWADAVAVGDINGDGLDDIALTTTSYFDEANDHKVFVYYQKSDGTLQAPQKYSYGWANQTGLALADLDGDGRKDIIVGQGGGITVLCGRKRGGRPMSMQSHMYEGNHRVVDVAVLDVDRDGKLDIVGQGWDEGATNFLGDGKGCVRKQVELDTPVYGYDDIEAGDFNGDGFADLAVLSGQGITDTYVYYNDGSDDLSAPTIVSPGTGENSSGSLAGGDFDGDGRQDLAVMGDRTHILLYAQAANGTLAPPLGIVSDLDPNAMMGADLDSDGKDDLIVQHGGGALGYYLQGAGVLSAEVVVPGPYATWFNTQGLAVGDINGDSCPDVVTANYNYGLVVFPGSCPAADLAVSVGLTSTVAAIRLDNRGVVDAVAPQTDVTLSLSSGTLSMGAMPVGCSLRSQTTRTASIRCDGDTIFVSGNATVLLPVMLSGTDIRSRLQVIARATTTTLELALKNNTASRLLRPGVL
jgi:hypothetical protein